MRLILSRFAGQHAGNRGRFRNDDHAAVARANHQQREQHVLALQRFHQFLRNLEFQLADLRHARFHRRPHDVLRVGRIAQHDHRQLSRVIVDFQPHNRVQRRRGLRLRRVKPHELRQIQAVRVDGDHRLDGALRLLGIPSHRSVLLFIYEGVHVGNLVHRQLIHGQNRQIIRRRRLVPPRRVQLNRHVLRGRAGYIRVNGGRCASCHQHQYEHDSENAFRHVLSPLPCQNGFEPPGYSK